MSLGDPLINFIILQAKRDFSPELFRYSKLIWKLNNVCNNGLNFLFYLKQFLHLKISIKKLAFFNAFNSIFRHIFNKHSFGTFTSFSKHHSVKFDSTAFLRHIFLKNYFRHTFRNKNSFDVFPSTVFLRHISNKRLFDEFASTSIQRFWEIGRHNHYQEKLWTRESPLFYSTPQALKLF